MYTGFIYQIVADNTDKIYFGSTIQSINSRFKAHKTPKNPCCSRELFNYPNTRIELIETCSNIDKILLKEELKNIESEYIIRCRQIKPNTCVNYQTPNRTRKQWHYDNPTYMREYHKKYQIDKKDKLRDKTKQYYIDNKDKKKQYYNNNKDKIKERDRLRYLKKKLKFKSKDQ
jgi:hypothetical protein